MVKEGDQIHAVQDGMRHCKPVFPCCCPHLCVARLCFFVGRVQLRLLLILPTSGLLPRILQAPRVLVLTLKRFEYDQSSGVQSKRNHPVVIPTTLNIGMCGTCCRRLAYSMIKS